MVCGRTLLTTTLSPGESTSASSIENFSDNHLFRIIAPNTTSTTDGNSSRTTCIVSKGELKGGTTVYLRGDAPDSSGNGIFIIWKLIDGRIKNVTTPYSSGFSGPAVLVIEDIEIS